jgi:hypothetical protein
VPLRREAFRVAVLASDAMGVDELIGMRKPGYSLPAEFYQSP